MDPRNGAVAVAALDENGGTKGGDGLGDELKRFVWRVGEEVHQELMGRLTVEPPLEVGAMIWSTVSTSRELRAS
ncbi:hypothetical protein ACFX11_014287 [Malus domestica]